MWPITIFAVYVSSTVNYWLSWELALGWSGRFEQQNQPLCNKLNWLMVRLMFHTGREHSKSQASYVCCSMRDRKRTWQLFLLADAKLHCLHTNVTTFSVIITWWPDATQLPEAWENTKGQYHFLRRGTLVYLCPWENFEERQGMKNDWN